MLVSSNKDSIDRARFLATQAREPFAHYQHESVGYNYRLSNLLAAVGRGQLAKMPDKVARRREIFETYKSQLSQHKGITFMPEADFGVSNRWLSVISIDTEAFGESPMDVRLRLEESNIEARPVWKPMHMQPVFKDCQIVGGKVAEDIFATGLCLPSGSGLSPADQQRVLDAIANK